VIFASLPFQLRIIAKASLGNFPFLGWHLRRAGHLLVERSNPDRSGILNRWRRLVADRISLIIFPEGTRSADGRVGRFRGGSFLLALEAGLTIVPISISGTIHVMKKGRLMTRPGHPRLIIHVPVPASKIDNPTIADARELATRIEAIVRAGVELDKNNGSRRL
jgi:1-acyl-sn-glycerol-3-phosphate acyltransferase